MQLLDQKNRRPYISWSQYKLWRKSPTEYEDIYLYGGDSPTSSYMELGSEIHEDIEKGTSKVAGMELIKVLLPNYKEHEKIIKTTVEGVPMLGKIDLYEETKKEIRMADLKTSKNKWTQRQADTLKQLVFYNMMLKMPREAREIETRVYWIGTDGESLTGEFQSFKVDIKFSDILMLFARVKRAWKEINDLWNIRIKEEL